MKIAPTAAIAAGLCLSLAPAMAQTDATFTTTFVQLQGGNSLGLLYEPRYGPVSNIALIFEHPDRNNFTDAVAQQVVTRGYKILMVDNRADRDEGDAPEETFLPSISQGIAYLRTLKHVKKVVLIGHSGGGHLAALYENVAENGPAACSGPEKIYPCDTSRINNLEVPDGFILLDSTTGAGHQMSAVDPAIIDGGGRNPSLDFLNPDNGFNPATKSASYPPEFVDAFYAAQAARNNTLIDNALARLALIDGGNGDFANDEPLLLRGVGIRALGARLYQPDIRFQAHTKDRHLVLRGDGTRKRMILQSVRSPTGDHAGDIDVLGSMNYQTTVRGFLANSAVRTTPGYAFTADDIVGVDWASSITSTPSNATGIHVPALIMNMGCHYLMVPGEIIYNNLASADKTYVGVEGATHGFTACGAQYGDTRKRVFDYVNEWLSKRGRFSQRN